MEPRLKAMVSCAISACSYFKIWARSGRGYGCQSVCETSHQKCRQTVGSVYPVVIEKESVLNDYGYVPCSNGNTSTTSRDSAKRCHWLQHLPRQYFPTRLKACNYCMQELQHVASNNCTWNHGIRLKVLSAVNTAAGIGGSGWGIDQYRKSWWWLDLGALAVAPNISVFFIQSAFSNAYLGLTIFSKLTRMVWL